MRFVEMKRIYPDQPMWSAIDGPFTFIITRDDDRYSASAKVGGATPFDGTRHDLGGYQGHETFEAAQEACEKFVKDR